MEPSESPQRRLAVLVVVLGLWSFLTSAASAQTYSFGWAETIAVPAVIESWSATATSIPPRPENRVVHPIGHFPGFREAKRQANELRRGIGSRPGQTPTQAATQAGVATPVAGAVALAPASGLVLDGPSESDTHFIPPDPVVAAGPNNIVVLINSLMAIYDKSGNLQGGFQQLGTFFGGLGITGEIFDPRIIYDQTDNRFILTAAEVDMTSFTNGNVFIAVSQTSDPTGVWNKYAVNFKGRNLWGTANTFPDFPTTRPTGEQKAKLRLLWRNATLFGLFASIGRTDPSSLFILKSLTEFVSRVSSVSFVSFGPILGGSRLIRTQF